MIKVVIADDEERICRLIQALVDWEALGMQVVGTAANGLEALEVIEKEKPDILITDIRMPGCNGLELISKIREQSEDIRIIIISGYAQFEYAQTAMKYGVSEYLLKPINRQELQDTLVRLGTEIARERQENEEEFVQGRKMDLNRLRGSFILDLLDEQDRIFTEEMIREQYHMDIQSGFYQAFCMKMDYQTDKMSHEDVCVLQNKMKQILDCGMQRDCHEWVMVPRKGYIYGMMNFSTKQSDKIRNMLRECVNQLDAQKNLLGEVEFSLGIGEMVKTPGDLQASLTQAKLAVEERLLEGTGRLLIGKDGKSTLFEQKPLDKFSKRIDNAIEVLSVEEVGTAIEELYQSILETPQVRGWEIFELVKSAGDMMTMKLGHVSKDRVKEFEEACQNCSNVEGLITVLKTYAQGLMQEVLKTRKEDASRPVRIAKQYIQNHYNEQITLEEVSEKVALTPAYFSILFKKETEVGFAKYVMNVRMEQAKVLLRESGYSVAEICKKVGYNDTKHFGHTFEKVAGVKPATYRKLYG